LAFNSFYAKCLIAETKKESALETLSTEGSRITNSSAKEVMWLPYADRLGSSASYTRV